MDKMDTPPLLNSWHKQLPQMTLRPLHHGDIEQLHRHCYPHQELFALRAKLQSSLAWQAKGQRVHLVVIDLEEQVIGAGHVGRYGRKAEIADVIVSPIQRNQGYGTALTQHLCHIAQAQNWLPLEIGVLAENRGAMRLYKRLGFKQVQAITLVKGETAFILRYHH